MAKQKKSHDPDIVTETRQNARWFLGSRSDTSWTDMTPSEWSRLRRSLPLQRIITIIFLFGLVVLLILQLVFGNQQGNNSDFLSQAALFFIIVFLIGIAMVLFRKKK